MAFNQMLSNLEMVHHIEDNFKETNKKVKAISFLSHVRLQNK